MARSKASKNRTIGFGVYVDDVEAATIHPLPSFNVFWDFLRKGILKVRSCNKCGTLFSPARVCCPRCLSMDLGWLTSSGKGTVYSYSTVYRAFDPALNLIYLKNRLPYILVLVRLEEGVFMVSNLVGCRPAEVKVGMNVTIDFKTVRLPRKVPSMSKIRLPPFKPLQKPPDHLKP